MKMHFGEQFRTSSSNQYVKCHHEMCNPWCWPWSKLGDV